MTILNTLIEVQGWIRAELAAYLDAFASTSDWTWLIAVLPVGVFFGAVHALTPGHGKLVVVNNTSEPQETDVALPGGVSIHVELEAYGSKIVEV